MSEAAEHPPVKTDGSANDDDPEAASESSVAEDVRRQFDKLFHFQPGPDDAPVAGLLGARGSRPEAQADPEFLLLRSQLNSTKSRLNTMPLSQWHAHTKWCNPAGAVIAQVNQEIKPEMLTQAWCKFTECLHQFPCLSAPVDGGVTSVHLCEAPGAFVAALNHYLHSQIGHGAAGWTWRATTLNPYLECNSTNQMINDDRLISRTLSHWDFGRDQTGDILSLANRRHYVSRFRPLGVSLVTADGSIDCQRDPARQEALVGPLHLAEAAVALGVLARGGHLVIKMFTFFEPGSLTLLHLLRRSFRHVSVFKPATSKEGNSEVYVVARDYLDNLTAGQRDALLIHCTDDDPSPLSLNDVPSEFVKEVLTCARYFKDLQTRVILRNLGSFDPDRRQRDKRTNLLRTRVADEFIRRCQLRLVPHASRLSAQHHIVSVYQCRNLDERVEQGTFEDNARAAFLRGAAELRQDWLKLRLPWRKEAFQQVEWTQCHEIQAGTKLSPVYGRKMDGIASSKFCVSKAVQLFWEGCRLAHGAPATSTNFPAAKKSRFCSGGDDGDDSDSDALSEPMRELPAVKAEFELVAKLASMYPEIDSAATKIVLPHSYAEQRLSRPAGPTPLLLLKDYVQVLLHALERLQTGEYLVLLDFFCISRLDVALLKILLNSFTEIGFVRPRGKEGGAIFLSEFVEDKGLTKELLVKFAEAIESAGNFSLDEKSTESKHESASKETHIESEKAKETLPGQSSSDLDKTKESEEDKDTLFLQELHEVLPITQLVEEPVYSLIVEYNLLYLKERSFHLLKSVL